MEQVTGFFSFFSGNPLVTALVAIAVVMLLLSFFRTALKLLVVAAAAVVLYAGWLQASGGGGMAETFGEVLDVLRQSFERLMVAIRPLFELLKLLQ